MDSPLSTLTHLQSVTLETIDKVESAVLVHFLPLLQNSGMLRRRSCVEAEQARHARDETLHPDEVAREQYHVVSPLWCCQLDEYTEDDRVRWSVFRGI